MGIWNSKNRIGQFSSNWNNKTKKYNCLYCNKEFEDLEINNRKYCSKECSVEDRKGKNIKKSGKRVSIKCSYCGDDFDRLSCNIKETTKYNFCSMDCKSKWMSKNNRGSNNCRWITDRNRIKEPNILRNLTEMNTWRKSIYDRDNYTCQMCNSTSSGHLNAHHIKKLSTNPDLAYNIDNGITLCEDCHKLVNWNEKEYEFLFDCMINGIEC